MKYFLNTLILVAIFIDTASRFFYKWGGMFHVNASWYNAWDVFDYANIFSLIVFAACCWGSTKNIGGAALTIIMVSLMYDKIWGHQTHVGINDLAFYTVAALSLFLGRKRGDYFWLMICIALVKIATDNNHDSVTLFGIERTIFEMGNSFVFVPMAMIYARTIKSKTFIIPGFAIIAALNDFVDNVFFNPGVGEYKEFIFGNVSLIIFLLYTINSKYKFIDLSPLTRQDH